MNVWVINVSILKGGACEQDTVTILSVKMARRRPYGCNVNKNICLLSVSRGASTCSSLGSAATNVFGGQEFRMTLAASAYGV